MHTTLLVALLAAATSPTEGWSTASGTANTVPGPTTTLPDGLDRARLPEGTRWVAHVDIEGLRTSALFQEARAHAGEDFDQELAEVEEEIGVNPLRDVKSVTLYGAGHTQDKDSAVLMVRATSKVDAVLEKARQQEGYRAIEVDGLTLHSWADRGWGELDFDDDAPFAYVHGSGSADRVVIVSTRQDLVLRGARVLAGGGRSLAQDTNAALRTQARPGTFLFIEAADPISELAGVEPVSRVASMMRGFTLELGESNGSAFLGARLETSDGDEARKVGDIVRGAKSLVSLAAGSELPLIVSDLVDALHVNASGTFVTIDLAFDSRRLVRELAELEDDD